MTITRQQFAAIAPHAAPATADALFAMNRDGQRAIDRILAEHGITEPPAVAMFLTLCSLASYGFAGFDLPGYGLSALDWLVARAREWHDHGLSEYAAEWQWVPLLDYASALYGFSMAYRVEDQRLAEVCAVLGVENRSEELALDRGASEM